jgi:hypothetical protein
LIQALGFFSTALFALLLLLLFQEVLRAGRQGAVIGLCSPLTQQQHLPPIPSHGFTA